MSDFNDGWGANGDSATNNDYSANNDHGASDNHEVDAEKMQKEAEAKKAFTEKSTEHGWTEAVPGAEAAYNDAGGLNGDWFGNAKVYEWKDEYGDVAPADAELEHQLFGNEHTLREGQHREALEVKVLVEGPQQISPINSFGDAGLHPVVLQNVQLCHYTKPTPIQAYTIPAVLQGNDVVGIAQTGSGKTAAYLVPTLSKLMGKAKKLAAPRPDPTVAGFDPRIHGVRAEPLVVIVVPTRELAIQIFDEARRLCYRSMLRPCVAYGGFPMKDCIDELSKGCDILIGTPGRLCDLLDRPHVLSMSRVKFTIIDEADEMLQDDWTEELTKIMSGADSNEDPNHVYMMFSATFPKEARKLAREYMTQDYIRIRVGRTGSAHKNIRQNIIYVDQNMKRDAVYDLLFQSEPARTLIFCNSKAQVDLLDDFLYNRQLPTTSIHSDRNQKEREDAIRAFRTGRAPILIATGVSARGWDIKDVAHVINYDLPSGMYGGISEYIHRIGRTARMGHQGLATSFYNDRNEDLGQDLVNILVECDCAVPEFLSHLAPEEGAEIDHGDDKSDDEDNEDGGDTGGDAWGGPAADNDGGAPVADESFSADQGFTADGDNTGGSAW